LRRNSKLRHTRRMDSSEQKLKNAFQTVLGLNGSTDFSKVAYGQTQGWDSVAHMALVAEIEAQFDIMLETEDVIDLSSFQKGQEILSTKYGVEFA
jgi:acyl carrier protein